MFFGTYTPKLDDKGRLFLPAKFRDELAEGLVVTRGQERCLTCGRRPTSQAMTERLREAPLTNKGTRDYVRMLFAGRGAGGARQAGPGHDPADAARVRLAQQGRDGDRRDGPDRDLGPGVVGGLLRGAGADVRGAQRRGLPRHLAPTSTAARSNSTAGFAGRGLGPAPWPSGAPSPVPEDTFPKSGAGRDLVRRIRLHAHRQQGSRP